MNLLFTVISRTSALLVIAVPVVFCIIYINSYYYHPPNLREGYQYISGPSSLPYLYFVYVFSPWTFVSFLVAGGAAWLLWKKKLTLLRGIILVVFSLALSLVAAVNTGYYYRMFPPGTEYVHEAFY